MNTGLHPIPRLDEIVFDPVRDVVGVVIGQFVKKRSGTAVALLRLADGTEVESLPFFKLQTPTRSQLAAFKAARAATAAREK